MLCNVGLRDDSDELSVLVDDGKSTHSMRRHQSQRLVEIMVGIDRDQDALHEAKAHLSRFGTRFRGVAGRFSRLAEIVQQAGFSEVGGVLYDLGVSSMQLDRADRGFGYRSEGPLDMRMGRDESGPAASDVVRSLPLPFPRRRDFSSAVAASWRSPITRSRTGSSSGSFGTNRRWSC